MTTIHAELKEILSRDGSIGDGSDVPYEVKSHAHSLCADFIGGAWKKATPDDTLVTRMKGGMSNMLFLCNLQKSESNPSKEPRTLLLRVYFNPETESHLVAESVIFSLLSERQLGPRLYGIFNGGRLEEYIVSRPLIPQDIREQSMSIRIAQKLAHVHQLNVPISKEPIYICDALNRWVTQLLQLVTDIPPFAVTTPSGETQEINTKVILDEINNVRTALSKSKSPVVFCHNDLQEGNILLPLNTDGPTDIVFIDFEVFVNIVCHEVNDTYLSRCGNKMLYDALRQYASYNYRAFDFANHFCEWAIDYTIDHKPYFLITQAYFPNDEQKECFAKAYLQASHLPSDGMAVKAFMEEVKPFIPVSHFFWGIWALLSQQTSPLTFGFADYARQRLGYYFHMKGNLLKLIGENSY